SLGDVPVGLNESFGSRRIAFEVRILARPTSEADAGGPLGSGWRNLISLSTRLHGGSGWNELAQTGPLGSKSKVQAVSRLGPQDTQDPRRYPHSISLIFWTPVNRAEDYSSIILRINHQHPLFGPPLLGICLFLRSQIVPTLSQRSVRQIRPLGDD